MLQTCRMGPGNTHTSAGVPHDVSPCRVLQCSGYTCGTGYTADAGKQSTACSSGTCTDNFCCEPQVRKHHAPSGFAVTAACRLAGIGKCSLATPTYRHLLQRHSVALCIACALMCTHAPCHMRMQCSTYTCGAGFTADTSKQSTVCPSGTCTDGFCCQPAVRLMIRQLSHMCGRVH
jgi:hypothetical protein